MPRILEGGLANKEPSHGNRQQYLPQCGVEPAGLRGLIGFVFSFLRPKKLISKYESGLAFVFSSELCLNSVTESSLSIPVLVGPSSVPACVTPRAKALGVGHLHPCRIIYLLWNKLPFFFTLSPLTKDSTKDSSIFNISSWFRIASFWILLHVI